MDLVRTRSCDQILVNNKAQASARSGMFGRLPNLKGPAFSDCNV